MKYDFDRITDRRGTNCEKWNVAEHELPMWVADMDFQAAPAILETVQKRAAHGVFGYQGLSDAWHRAYMDWWRQRHGLTIEKDWLLFCTGIVPAISSMVRKLTTPAEKVLIQPPVYHVFYHSILENGRRVLENHLLYDGEGYRMDFEDLERKLSDPQTTLMILCNPHNPAGRLWNAKELEQVGELCRKYHVTVISDEIHCDLTDPGVGYIPFASLSEACRENSVTCLAPTKTFNIAGLKTAAVFTENEALRHKVRQALHTDGIAEPNAFAVDAAVAAFTRGADWLDELREYVFQNKQTAIEFLARELPQVKAVPAQATYLLWLDCRSVTEDSEMLARAIRKKTGLYLSDGKQFGGDGIHFLRMNIACPRALLLDGLQRLKRGIAAGER